MAMMAGTRCTSPLMRPRVGERGRRAPDLRHLRRRGVRYSLRPQTGRLSQSGEGAPACAGAPLGPPGARDITQLSAVWSHTSQTSGRLWSYPSEAPTIGHGNTEQFPNETGACPKSSLCLFPHAVFLHAAALASGCAPRCRSQLRRLPIGRTVLPSRASLWAFRPT